MTEREILSNAIDKAIANGYMLLPMQGTIDHLDIPLYPYHFYGIIFSHSFAQHFWSGDERKHEWYINFEISGKTDRNMYCDEWQYHLAMMVLEKNPIKYLERFL